MKEKQHGGARAGAGRTMIYGEKTTTVQFTVPISKKEDFRQYCNEKLNEWLIINKKDESVKHLDDGELVENIELSDTLLEQAKSKYKTGTIIKSESMPNVKLRVGFGIFSDTEKNEITVGCNVVDSGNGYVSGIILYKNGLWAKIC